MRSLILRRVSDWFGLVWVGLACETGHAEPHPTKSQCLVWFGLVWFGLACETGHAEPHPTKSQ